MGDVREAVGPPRSDGDGECHVDGHLQSGTYKTCGPRPEGSEVYELDLGKITSLDRETVDGDGIGTNRGIGDARKSTIFIAYLICSVSTIVSHIIRKPLATSKVNIQKSFGSSTFELSYLDTSFLLLYSFGQLVTPSIFPKSHTILLASFFHLIIGISLISLLYCGTLTSFVILYGIIGFSCAPAWTLIFQDLHVWLPEKNRHFLVTLWCCQAEVGYIIGTLFCAEIQTEVNWRCLFVIGGLLNLMVWAMILSCYIEPGHEDVLYVPNRLINPVTIGRANIIRIFKGVDNFISRYKASSRPTVAESGRRSPPKRDSESGPIESSNDVTPLHSDQFGVILIDKNIGVEKGSKIEASRVLASARRTVNRCYRGVNRHLLEFSDLVKRVRFVNNNALAYTLVRIAKNCFAFWISFFVTTHLGYSIKNGIYTTLLFELGSCLGSLLSGLISKLVLKKHPITASTISSVFASLSIFALLAVDLSKIRTAFLFIFIIGATTTCLDTLMITRNIRVICEDCTGKVS
ncbi:hypothetical protein BEWA_030420 [Theileria equi strain WA]|uniref:Major facilitator superfamily (MFS) profile domain-containing protein n=1 Tax=Theileria equi strain WA TaxID=1537102 RepID=L0AZ61_THEEQ|nr:hypothetical protein BEWA_030420 [Theileria equi strain WA]AFZ80189.1 hypothetical protein BEWA_030420 [Theileria equi strain WA]|eukprot:XP_004829855.1 hypothetical protein BEWA_030420 [Theileria equi strain WA]